MKFLVSLLAISLVSYAASSCLKGWDITLALRESKLNQALAVSTLLLSQYNIPPTNSPGQLAMDPAAGWGKKTSINLHGFKINQLQLNAVEGQMHEAKLTVGFYAGTVRVSTELVKADGSSFGVPPSNVDIPVAHTSVKFRVRVTAYQLNIGSTGGSRYSVTLEIVDDDAIIGTLDWNVPLMDVTAVRGALTEMMKRELTQGSKLHLANFDLPSGFDKNLLPKKVRFATLYSANGQSVFGALVTTDQLPTEGGFNWKTTELLPAGKAAALKISSNKFMTMMKPSIAAALSVPASKLSIRGICPKTIELNGEIGGWQSKTTLKEGKIQLLDGTNRVKVYVKLHAKVSDGITATVNINLELSISYDKNAHKFVIKIEKKDHNTKYHRKWWVVLLEVVSLGFGRIVTKIIENVADGVIKGTINSSLNIGPGTGTEIVNISGVMKEVFKNLAVGDLKFTGGNFLMDFTFF